MNVVKIGQLFAGTAERPAAILTSVILFVLCAVYVAIGVRSFIAGPEGAGRRLTVSRPSPAAAAG